MGDVKWSDVKRIALGEVGYTEGANNYNKYGAELSKIGYFNSDKTYTPWCASFVAWCFYKAAAPDPKGTALAAQYQPTKDNCGCGCPWNATYYRNKKKLFTDPKEGDVFYLGKIGNETHMGFVYKIYDNYSFDSIEGNHNNKVAIVRRKFAECCEFGRPWWTAEDPEPTPSKKQIIIDVTAPDDCEVILNVNKILES